MRRTTFLFAAAISILLLACQKPITHTCPPDNRTCVTYPKAEKKWPSIAKSHKSGIKATVDVLEKVKVGVDGSTESTVTELRDKLNQSSARFEIIAKAAYLGFSIDPCGPGGTEYWKILNEMVSLEKLRTDLSKLAIGGNFAGVDDNQVTATISSYKQESDRIGVKLYQGTVQ